MSQQIPERIPGGAIDLSHLVSPAGRGPAPAQGAPAQDGGVPGGGGGPAPAGGPGQIVDVPSVVLELNEQAFDQMMQLSGVVPIVVELNRPGSGASTAILEQLVRRYEGRLVLAKVDIDASPNLAQAFQVQSVPTVVALLAGRPVPLFQGIPPEEQLRELFDQLTQLAAQQGVTGRVNAPDLGAEAGDDEAAGGEAEPAINPAHAPALEALERGDYAAAIEAYEQVLLKAPADQEARAALVQVRLLHRLEGASADEIRQAAADAPDDIDAQLRVADLDLSGGHIEDAFDRLLDVFSRVDDADEQTKVRERLLELFETVGISDPRVAAARARLASLLY